MSVYRSLADYLAATNPLAPRWRFCLRLVCSQEDVESYLNVPLDVLERAGTLSDTILCIGRYEGPPSDCIVKASDSWQYMLHMASGWTQSLCPSSRRNCGKPHSEVSD